MSRCSGLSCDFLLIFSNNHIYPKVQISKVENHSTASWKSTVADWNESFWAQKQIPDNILPLWNGEIFENLKKNISEFLKLCWWALGSPNTKEIRIFNSIMAFGHWCSLDFLTIRWTPLMTGRPRMLMMVTAAPKQCTWHGAGHFTYGSILNYLSFLPNLESSEYTPLSCSSTTGNSYLPHTALSVCTLIYLFFDFSQALLSMSMCLVLEMLIKTTRMLTQCHKMK